MVGRKASSSGYEVNITGYPGLKEGLIYNR
jgi:hypothetical protein